MKTCCTKLCESPRKVFCDDHRAILCYGCKDKYHERCNVKEIIDPERITENVRNLLNLLDVMKKDKENLNLDMHITGVDQFIQEHQGEAFYIRSELAESMKEDTFIEYPYLLDLVLILNRKVASDIVFQKYCSFIVKFNATQSLQNDQKLDLCEEIIGYCKSEPSHKKEEITQKTCIDYNEPTELDKLYESMMACSLESNRLKELELNLNIDKEIELVNEIMKKNICISQLRSLTISNCIDKAEVVKRFIKQSLSPSTTRLSLTCKESYFNMWSRNPQFIIDELQNLIKKPKEICLSHWFFQKNDLCDLLSACNTSRIVKIDNFFCGSCLNFYFKKDIEFKIEEIQVHTFYENSEMNLEKIKMFIIAVSECSLKKSLKKMYIRSSICKEKLSELKSHCKSAGLDTLEVIETP